MSGVREAGRALGVRRRGEENMEALLARDHGAARRPEFGERGALSDAGFRIAETPAVHRDWHGSRVNHHLTEALILHQATEKRGGLVLAAVRHVAIAIHRASRRLLEVIVAV